MLEARGFQLIFLMTNNQPESVNETGTLDCLLQFAIEHLVESIQTYESDTWSSSDANVDRAMAEKMAATLIYQKFFDEGGAPIELDGADIGFAWESVIEAEGASLAK